MIQFIEDLFDNLLTRDKPNIFIEISDELYQKFISITVKEIIATSIDNPDKIKTPSDDAFYLFRNLNVVNIF